MISRLIFRDPDSLSIDSAEALEMAVQREISSVSKWIFYNFSYAYYSIHISGFDNSKSPTSKI